jgi:AbrB family looped-hinge helix DNA binding protein
MKHMFGTIGIVEFEHTCAEFCCRWLDKHFTTAFIKKKARARQNVTGVTKNPFLQPVVVLCTGIQVNVSGEIQLSLIHEKIRAMFLQVRKEIPMAILSTTRMSSKGQVVIPEDIRSQLRLEAGAQFVVLGEGDTVILKAIQTLSMKDFDVLIAKARKQARIAKLKKGDVATALSRVRNRK